MGHNCLIYIGTDGLYHVEDRNRTRIAGSPVKTREQAEVIANNHAGCLACVRASRETTLRELGCYYDPTD